MSESVLFLVHTSTLSAALMCLKKMWRNRGLRLVLVLWRRPHCQMCPYKMFHYTRRSLDSAPW